MEDLDALWDDLSRQVMVMVLAALPAAEQKIRAESPNATYLELRGMFRSARYAVEEDAMRQVILLEPEPEPGTEDKSMPGIVMEGWDR